MVTMILYLHWTHHEIGYDGLATPIPVSVIGNSLSSSSNLERLLRVTVLKV